MSLLHRSVFHRREKNKKSHDRPLRPRQILPVSSIQACAHGGQISDLVVDRLKRNDPELTRLTLVRALDCYVRQSFKELLEAFCGNAMVQAVHLGPYFYGSLTDAQLADVFKAMGASFVNLEVLTIGTLERTYTVIPGASLGQLVKSAHKLNILRVERFVSVSNDDLQMLANCFKRHPSLQRISIPFLHYEGGEEPQNMDPLFTAIATLPKLESLQIGLSPPCYDQLHEYSLCSLSTFALSSIITSKTLTWFALHRFDLSDVHVMAMATSLASDSSRLRILDLPGNRKVTTLGWQSLLSALQQNCYLETIELYAPREAQSTRRAVYVHLRLNRNGRRLALRDELISKREWLDTIGNSYSNDLLAVYVLLRDNPSICCP